MQTRKWTDQSGTEKYTTEVVIGRFKGDMTLLGGNRGEEGGAGEGGGGGYRAPARAPAAAGAGGGGRGGPSWDAPKAGDLDDEIPF